MTEYNIVCFENHKWCVKNIQTRRIVRRFDTKDALIAYLTDNKTLLWAKRSLAFISNIK